jgi:hypothetical protein
MEPELVSLVHADLPGRVVTVPVVQFHPLSKVGWKQANRTLTANYGGEIGVVFVDEATTPTTSPTVKEL